LTTCQFILFIYVYNQHLYSSALFRWFSTILYCSARTYLSLRISEQSGESVAHYLASYTLTKILKVCG